MVKYNLEIKRSAVKELNKIPRKDLKKIIKRIKSLADDPRPADCVKLSGDEKYRIRQGNYRILYSIHDTILIVCVVRIAHRKDAYKY
ncbi:type II toxin-antitoxin system RelE/ParE family toxin [Planctomycetota bacterium]